MAISFGKGGQLVSTPSSSKPTINIPGSNKTTSGGGGGGGSSLPQSSPTNITPAASSNQTMESVAAQSYNPQQKSYPLNTLFNPQAASQQAQQSQKDLVSKNDVTQREAIQRDQNYSLATSSKEPSGTLNVYNPNDFNFQGNIKSVGTGIGGFFSSVGGDIKSFFTGRGDETYTNPFSAFENTGGQVGNQKANSIYSSSFGLLPSEDSFNAAKTYFEAKYSGVNYPVNPTNFQMQDIKLGITKAKNPEIANYLTTNPAQTQFNVQQQFNVESNKLEADIQSKINTGALTLDMGKENYATGVSELQTKYNTISSKANSLIDYSPGLYERTGTVFARDATSIALLGASFIPELSPILFNAGAYYGNNEVLSAGIFGAGLGAVGALIKMPTEVKILQREQTLESPILPKSVQLYEKGNEKFYMVTSKQGDMMTTGAEITTKTQFPVFETNEGWKIGEGFGRQTIREYGFNQGSLELGERPFASTETFGFRGSAVETTGKLVKYGDNMKLSFDLPEGTTAFRGEGLVNTKGGLVDINFAGFGKELNNKFSVARSGDITSASLTSTEGINTFKATAKLNEFSVTDTTRSLNLNLVEKDVFGFSGGGAKSSKGFFKDLYSGKESSFNMPTFGKPESFVSSPSTGRISSASEYQFSPTFGTKGTISVFDYTGGATAGPKSLSMNEVAGAFSTSLIKEVSGVFKIGKSGFGFGDVGSKGLITFSTLVIRPEKNQFSLASTMNIRQNQFNGLESNSKVSTISGVTPISKSMQGLSIKSSEIQGQLYKQESFFERPQKFEQQFNMPFKSSFKGLGDFGGFGDMPSLGGFALPNYKRRGKKSNEFNIAPSFTGIVENIKMTAPLKVSSSFGVTPFQSRGLFVGKRSKKERYFQLTDI